jgi:hypothetical protein
VVVVFDTRLNSEFFSSQLSSTCRPIRARHFKSVCRRRATSQNSAHHHFNPQLNTPLRSLQWPPSHTHRVRCCVQPRAARLPPFQSARSPRRQREKRRARSTRLSRAAARLRRSPISAITGARRDKVVIWSSNTSWCKDTRSPELLAE